MTENFPNLAKEIKHKSQSTSYAVGMANLHSQPVQSPKQDEPKEPHIKSHHN